MLIINSEQLENFEGTKTYSKEISDILIKYKIPVLSYCEDGRCVFATTEKVNSILVRLPSYLRVGEKAE